MKNHEIILSVLLALILAFGGVAITPLSVSAAEKDIVDTAEITGGYKYEVNNDNTAEITGYTGEGGDVEIPSSIGGYTVTSIGERAFDDCTVMTSVAIPDSVKRIERGAFLDCTGLTSVTIGNSVTSIGDFAFAGCLSLMSINIPDSVTSIRGGAFYGCLSLTNVVIPDSATSIGDSAFGYYSDSEYNEYKFDDFRIYGSKGSEAERYADDNGFIFVPVRPSTVDEATPDEATPDEATPDEATPDEATVDEATVDEATPDEAILGDVDGDGEVTVTDATYIQRKIANIEIPFEICDAVADVDKDGQVTLMDATYIQSWLVKLINDDNIGRVIESAKEWLWPLPGNYYLTSVFDDSRGSENHGGVDIAAPAGTPIYAANSGTVVSAFNECIHSNAGLGGCSCGGGYGNYVWIMHDNGYETIYGQMVATAVSIGQRVSAGQLIGYVGSSGWSTGPHLHFELRINNVKCNPLDLY